MEKQEPVDFIVAAASVPDTTRQSMPRRSLEAVGAFEQLDAIVQFFASLRDALADLGQCPDSRAYQLAQETRTAMIQTVLSDFNEQTRAGGASGKR